MKAALIQQIRESTTRDLHALKTEHKDTLTEAVIDQEIRIRMLTETVRKLERERVDRKYKE